MWARKNIIMTRSERVRFGLPGGERVRGQRTLGQYRAIDLGIFAVLLAAFEFLLSRAGLIWFSDEAYVVSLTPLITALVMMRWGVWGAIHAALGGALFVLFYGGRGAGWQLYLVYGLGNLAGLAGLLLLWKPGWRTVQGSPWWTLGYGAAVLLGMQTGRMLLALLMGMRQGLEQYYLTEVITMLFTLVALWIMRRLDGMFENQRHYLRRVQQESLSKEEGGSE